MACPSGADPCGVDPCGVDPCGVDPCGVDPCGVDPCGVDPCGVDPCGVDSCGVDSCGADSCGGGGTHGFAAGLQWIRFVEAPSYAPKVHLTRQPTATPWENRPQRKSPAGASQPTRGGCPVPPPPVIRPRSDASSGLPPAACALRQGSRRACPQIGTRQRFCGWPRRPPFLRWRRETSAPHCP
jgi:hypothetical protein